MFVNHEGKERLGVYYSLNGTLDNLVKFRDGVTMMFEEDGVTPQTESYTFYGGKKDGYNAQRMIGKYYALQFAEKTAFTTQNAFICRKSPILQQPETRL